MPENRRIKKIVKLTRLQMKELQDSGSLYGHTYDPEHCFYQVDDGLELPTENGSYLLAVTNNGNSFDYTTLGTTVPEYSDITSDWVVDPEDENIRRQTESIITDVNVDFKANAGTYVLSGTEEKIITTENTDTGESTTVTTVGPYTAIYTVPVIANSSSEGIFATTHVGKVLVNDYTHVSGGANGSYIEDSSLKLTNWYVNGGRSKSATHSGGSLTLNNATLTLYTFDTARRPTEPVGTFTLKLPRASGTFALTDDIKKSLPTGQRSIITRLKSHKLTTGNDITLGQTIFTNNTGKTLYIVTDTKLFNNNNKNKMKRYLTVKGARTIPGDLEKRQKNWSEAISIDPNETVPLWKVLGIPLDTLQNTYNSDITENSQLYVPDNPYVYPQQDYQRKLNKLYNYYTITIDDSKVFVNGSDCYYNNRARRCNIFDQLFGTKRRAKCVYIVARGTNINPIEGNTYYTKKVYLALNIKFGRSRRTAGSQKIPGLTVTFFDINTFDYCDTSHWNGR